MQTTQLACPHCASTLNFGTEIAFGTPVECLICMRTFSANPLPSAQSIDSADSPTLSDTVTDVLPKHTAPAKAKTTPTAVLKTYPAPAKSTPKVAKAETKKADESSPLALRKPSSPKPTNGTNILALAGAAAILLVVLFVGVGLAVWKIRSSAPNDNSGEQLADAAAAKPKPTKTTKPSGEVNNGLPVVPATAGASGAAEPKDQAGKDGTDDGEEKVLLKRKTITGAGAEPAFDPITSLNVTKSLPVGLNQQRINEAIAKGVIYLRQTQKPDGTWANGHGVGHAAIGGLTMLECGVPGNDPAVQRAAYYVRTHVMNLTSTYELSLAILFLDRLGDIRDRPTIQGMGLRLLTGQNDCGGWSYNCQLLTPPDMFQLWTFLQSNRQPNLLDPLQNQMTLQTGINTDPKFVNPLDGKSPTLIDPFQALNSMMLMKGIAGGNNPNPNSATTPLAGGGTAGTTPMGNPQPSANTNPKRKGPAVPQPVQVRLPQAWLKPNLQKLPVVQNQGLRKGQQKLRRGSGDNSNTQFAILALWAARRHGVPTEQAILAAYERFVTSQHNDGGWGYTMAGHGTTPSMTCVGLLGHGMGHGTSPEIVRFDPANPRNSVVKSPLEDARIQTGLKTLSKFIGDPEFENKNAKFPMQNLYFLWSVERVAMLYDLKTIDGKDWYGWGAQILVHNQQPTGAWANSHYHGACPSLNTCLALLFLKRSNLVQDLTNNLRLYSGIRNPDAP